MQNKQSEEDGRVRETIALRLIELSRSQSRIGQKVAADGLANRQDPLSLSETVAGMQ